MSINRKRGALIGVLALTITFLTATSLAAALAVPVFASFPVSARHLPVRSPGQLPVRPAPHGDKAQEQSTAQSGQPADQAFINEPLLGKTILVDPGHGGSDPGAISGGVQEKTVTLNVSLLLRSKLEALGATVDMTRDSDQTLTLQERLDASNRSCPDVFIAVHGNSVAKTQIRGIETYYFDSRDQKLAEVVLDTVSLKLNEQAKWSHARNLFVLDGNDVPATLVEIGYLTNPTTRALLKTAAYQDKVASALTDSLVAYLADSGAERGCSV
ncbi:MAG: N-acetylmuramoyl-L-alanine amidase [Candidatus Obscuribacterales bacterium]